MVIVAGGELELATAARRRQSWRRRRLTPAAVCALLCLACICSGGWCVSSATAVAAMMPSRSSGNVTRHRLTSRWLPLELELWLAQRARHRVLKVLRYASDTQRHITAVRSLERQGLDGSRLVRSGGLSEQSEDAPEVMVRPPIVEMPQLFILEDRIRQLRHQRRLKKARASAKESARQLAQLRRSPLRRGVIHTAQAALIVLLGRVGLGALADRSWRELKVESRKLSAKAVENHLKPLLQPRNVREASQALTDVLAQALAFRALRQRFVPKKPITEGPMRLVSLDDVAGIGPAKAEALEIVECLVAPARFVGLGARCPKGLLLTGPPGCGKTLLARAIASTAGVPFIARSGADFNNRFAGVGSQLVKELFNAARAAAPAVVLIDELDYIGRKRGEERGGGLETDRSAALTQLLAEMDGFASGEGVVVIGTTNREDILDKALLRPGRFDRQVRVPLPDVTGRFQILRTHAQRLLLERGSSRLTGSVGTTVSPVDLRSWAKRTPGFSGADLAGLVNEAAMAAARESAWGVAERHMQAAYSKALLGVPSGRSPSQVELALTAAHEAGHAVVNEAVRAALGLDGMDTEGFRTVVHMSIVPTGGAGGFTQFAQPDESRRAPQFRKVLLAHLAVAMGGRAAEELHSDGEVTMGARSDYKDATQLATEMVTVGGLSEVIGPRSLNTAGAAPSQELLRQVDDEVSRLLRSALDLARRALEQNRPLFKAVAEALLDKETLDGEAFGALLRQHPVVAVKAG